MPGKRTRPLDAARRVIDAAFDAVPGSVVERVTSAGAPLTRYSGRSRAGAAALSSALARLAQPPRRRRRRSGSYGTDEIAMRVDEPSDVVEGWADAGLLGDSDGGAWPAEALDRAALLAFARKQGCGDADLAAAVQEGRLPLLILERVLAGDTPLTAEDVALRTGVPLDLAMRIWRALAFTLDRTDDRIFTRDDVASLRVIGALRSVFTDDDLIEASTVMGRALGEVSAAATELFRRRLTAAYLEAGGSELETALRLAAVTDLLVPTLGPLLEVVLRRHLAVAARAEAALRIEESGAPAPEQPALTIGFADMEGFTSASERLSALQLSNLASRLLACADATIVPRGGRIVKSIGDAVMFAMRDPVDAAAAAARLIDAAADEGLPPVRAGLAHGPVMRAYADFFGRTVNLAARLCDRAESGSILLHAPEVEAAAVEQPGFAVASRRMQLKGVGSPVPVIELRVLSPAGRPRR